MRLGQLSRKLDISTTKIVSFIEEKFETTVENHPNTKIEDDFVETIETKFKKAETPKPVAKEEIPENKEVASITQSVQEVKEVLETKVEEVKPTETIEEVVVATEEKIEEAEIDTSIELEVPTNMENVELIKAPKPKLQEIKVLRKIKLPNTKKAEKPTESEEVTEEKPTITAKDVAQLERELKESIEQPTPVKKKSTYKRPNKPMKKTKSVDEILAEKRKREEEKKKREEKKEKQQKEYEKKLKKEHYASQVKDIAPKKKKKKKKINKAEVTKVKTQKASKEEKPKSWIGKLIHWFQTED